MSYLNINTVDFSQLKFPRQKSNSGTRFISAFYNKKALGLKLPKLRIPFDSQLSRYGQLEFNISLGNNQEIIDKFYELDNQMVKFAEEFSWVEESCEYVPTLKESKNSEFPPTIRIKIPKKDNTIKTLFFDKEKKKVDTLTNEDVLALLTKGTHILSAIECVGVWFNDERFGLSWKAEQVRIVESPSTKKSSEDYAFEDDSDIDSLSDTELLIDDN